MEVQLDRKTRLKRLEIIGKRRGSKELDLIFSKFIDESLHDLDDKLLLQFENLLELNEVDLQDFFLEHLETYFGDATTYKFLSGLDGGMSDATTYDIGADRVIKTEFSMTVKGYVIPEFTTNMYGTVSETSYKNTKGKLNVTFTERL